VEVALVLSALATSSAAAQVVVPRGQAVQIALADDLTGFGATIPPEFATSIANAVQMAVNANPAVRGFPIRIDLVNAPCGDPAAVRNTTAYRGVTCTITLDPSRGSRVNDPTALSRCASDAE
jgi:hypothetical protein